MPTSRSWKRQPSHLVASKAILEAERNMKLASEWQVFKRIPCPSAFFNGSFTEQAFLCGPSLGSLSNSWKPHTAYAQPLGQDSLPRIQQPQETNRAQSTLQEGEPKGPSGKTLVAKQIPRQERFPSLCPPATKRTDLGFPSSLLSCGGFGLSPISTPCDASRGLTSAFQPALEQVTERV